MTDQTRPLNPAAVVPQRLAVDLVEEIDQQRTRAETAEQERESLAAEHIDLADRYAALQRLHDLWKKSAEDRLSDLSKARDEIRRQDADLTGILRRENAIARERDRANETLETLYAVRDSLAHDLDAMTNVARSNKQHVVMLMNVLDRIEQLTVVGDTDLTPDTTVTVAEILHALNEPFPAPLTAPPVFPGSSRRAQDDAGLVARVAQAIPWTALLGGVPFDHFAQVSIDAMAAQADPSAPPPGWAYMVGVDQLVHTVEHLAAMWPTPTIVTEADRDHLAGRLARVAEERAKLTPAGIVTPLPELGEHLARREAVIRTAIAWRLWYGDKYDPTFSSACNDHAAAVDALPHIGEPKATSVEPPKIRGVRVHRPDARRAADPDHPIRIELAGIAYADLNAAEAREIAKQLIGETLMREPGSAARADLPTYGDDAPGTLRSRP